MARQRWQRWVSLLLLLLLTSWGIITGSSLYRGAQRPNPDAILMLGGSIRREMYLAEQVAQGLSQPILISRGSPDPCIRRLFEQAAAPLNQVWLETCAFSTFDNFRYSLPTLQSWGVRRVRVVTSGTHVIRARWLGRIMLGGHGIWVEMVSVPEQGVPGNQERPLKTALDLLRGLGWVVISQVYNPPCASLAPLSAVDMALWDRLTYTCEHQGQLD
ncbi:YdcF family protein [Leptolyngbya sp. PCC 6406]|uniref:YdcF family protein n=1 Tax=Leptolyngbya sp. PCC 6406 TaxID=1173264 RepID=UPI0002ACBB14|nr:YdcF family protein [Leptolyngbya sp. PCC 6406]